MTSAFAARRGNTSIGYLADKVFALVVDVPEAYCLVRLPPAALPRALDGAFKLEEFSISLVPAALRSFVHHFHPAYSEPLTALEAEAEAEVAESLSSVPAWLPKLTTPG